MEHGGDLLTYFEFYKGEITDFSTNINPLGIPKALEKKLMERFNSIESYPDIKYRKLKYSVSKYLGCHTDNAVVGNGAVELIDNFILLAKRVVVITPSFSEYEIRAKVHGKDVIKIKYNDDFKIDIEDLENLLEDDLLIIGNPNNPTGLRIEEQQLLEIYNLVRDKNAFLLLDEAFYEFCPQDYDSIELFRKNDFLNVGIIRAATKFFALPGIRLGYACTSNSKVSQILGVELPWSVNSFANEAGQIIFSDEQYISNTRRYIDIERKYLLQELLIIKGISRYNTHSNYILIKLLNWNEEYIFNFFLKRGILIRKCSNFKDLGINHIRVAIKDRESNLKLINVFKELE